MAKFSIIIPVYNTESYLDESLSSAEKQSLADIEIIVVNDGSTDNSKRIIERHAAQDSRVKVITQENSGLHLARAAGVAHASGSYTLFLDSDDKLEPDACEMLFERIISKPVDILHFGTKAIPSSESLEQAAADFERFANSNQGFLENDEIQEAIFFERKGYQLDWRTWQRAFPTEFLKKAYELMTPERLDRAEDSHEGLVLACLATSFDSMDDYQGYVYRFGIGVSTSEGISESDYALHCEQFKKCLEASEWFAEKHPELVNRHCLSGLKNKAIEIIANDWMARVRTSDREKALTHFANTFGSTKAARELYRFMRDKAYSMLQNETSEYEQDIAEISRAIKSLGPLDGDEIDRCRLSAMQARALLHKGELDVRDRIREQTKKPYQIFVTMHDYFAKPDDSLFQPVQVGPNQIAGHNRFSTTLHDGDGESIADKNARYCEMTVQYWAWKNIEADYYGFCHYRRYFNFSDIPAIENDWGEIDEKYIDETTCIRYGLDEKSFMACIGDADVLITEQKDVSTFPDHNRSIYEHYKNADHLHVEDLDLLVDVIADLEPEYLDDTERYLTGSISCFCNMYVMKRDAFHNYCAWLFPLLEEFENRADFTHYNQQELRVTGHLAERLFNIYLLHNQRSSNPWKLKEVQCVRFADPWRLEPLHPAFDQYAVPVVFAADDNYSPILGTAIASLATHADPNTLYDIVVLSRNIQPGNQRLMRSSIANHKNISLRFFDVSRLVSNYKLTVNAHITEETYYRFLIQWILPEYPKVLYLDSDLVVNADVAELYETELGDNLLAATVDVDWAGNCNLSGPKGRIAYARDSLGMKDPYAYFQAGVLLLNTAEMAKLHSLREWLELAATPRLYNDQDVLNAECEGRVLYLDLKWNMMVDTGRVNAAIQYAPIQMYHDYMTSRNEPCIIHYAGTVKPWRYPDCDFGDVFWKHARSTPFYETLCKQLGWYAQIENWTVIKDMFLFDQGSRSFPRKAADVLLPYGSQRRELLKKALGRE